MNVMSVCLSIQSMLSSCTKKVCYKDIVCLFGSAPQLNNERVCLSLYISNQRRLVVFVILCDFCILSSMFLFYIIIPSEARV